MTSKEDLVRQAMGFHEEINRLIMVFKPEKWMALDLTIAQLKSIIFIQCKGKTNFKALAKALNVSPSVVTGIVDRLVSQEIINRVASTGDRRVQWLIITDKGRDLLNNIQKESIKEISDIMERLSYEDLSSLVRGFNALISAVGPYYEKSKVVA